MNRAERAKRRQRIAETVRAGATLAEAAERFGLSVAIVRRSCNEHTVKPPSIVARRHKAITDLVRRGASLPDLVRRFGVSGETIRRACRNAGVKVPPI